MFVLAVIMCILGSIGAIIFVVKLVGKIGSWLFITCAWSVFS